MNKKIINISCFILFFLSCSEQKARKPIAPKETSFISKSIENNKIILNLEKELFKKFKKLNPKNYIKSKQGFEFTFIYRDNTIDSIPIEKGDLLEFKYSVKIPNKNLLKIYDFDELGIQQYRMDEENIMSGLRMALKLMKPNDSLRVLLPSILAYGFHGDQNKIESNTPLILDVNLLKITPKNNLN